MLVGAESDAAQTAERVNAALARRNAETAEPFELSLSLGLATAAPGDESSLWDLVAAADAAMLEAKRAKKAGREGSPHDR